MKNLLLLLVCSVIVISCKKDPKADFSTSGSLKVGEAVVFNNSSSHFSGSSWDFGDGSSSADASPSHTYELPGNYDVTLEVTGNGTSHSITRTIAITGTTYVIKNTTTVTLYEFASFYWDGTTILDFTPYGILRPGESTNIIITTRTKIDFGFSFVSGESIYVSATPFLLIPDSHNILIIDSNTQIYGGGAKSDTPAGSVNLENMRSAFKQMIISTN